MGTQDDKKIASKPPTGGQRASPSGRGRRRLDFKRFQGKTMFLDLPGYRHVARLEQELTSRGATLETQFHAGVKYLITMTRNGDGKSHSQSPSTPSPLTPGKSSISQLLSPATDHSPSEATPVRHGILTRSQQMLQLSRGRGGRKADLRALAQQWGSKVVTLEELLTELKRLKPLPSAPAGTTGSSSSSSGARSPKVRVLRGAFLKVEDLSRNYRPLVLEMKRWPRPLCHASLKASPFDPPHTGKSPEQQQQQKMGGGGGGREKEKVEVRDKRPGHCECCSVKFEDLQMHLRSARHQQYASNEENFRSLDRLMTQTKSFDQFISELRSSPPDTTCEISLPTYTPPASSPVRSSRPDSIILLTPPTKTTPTRRSPRKHPGTVKHYPPNNHTPSPSPGNTDSKSTTPVNRKRKASSTPTNPVFEATPTKQLRFSPELTIPMKRLRSHSHSTTPPSVTGSPARKRARPAVTPSPSPEGVRRSPRLLMKQLAAAQTVDQ